jgi:nucleoside-diphosphate-sugar epimerase
MNVLYIGATGLVGSHVTPILREKFDLTLTAFGGGVVEGVAAAPLDITDWEAVEATFAAGGANGEPFDAVVNCAIANYRDRDWHNPDGRRAYFEQCIEVNARGAYHVFEAAARAKIPRVVFISSMTAMLGEPKYEFIGPETRDRPNDLYAACKIFGESVGRSYVYPRKRWRGAPPELIEDDYSMSVICLRLGQPIDPKRDYNEGRWSHMLTSGLALDMRDLALAIECALCADVRYGVYPVVSACEETYIDPALYAEIGYMPRWSFTAEDVVPVEEAGVPVLSKS